LADDRSAEIMTTPYIAFIGSGFETMVDDSRFIKIEKVWSAPMVAV
jgi:hypothetical protein